MSHNQKRGSWIVTLPLAASSIAYLVFIFLPGQKTAAELQSQIQEKRNHLGHVESLGAALVAAEEELRLTRKFREQWQTSAPSVTQISDLFGRIHRVETASGVQITRFDPQPVVPREHITEVPLSVGCTGTFADVFSLVRGLECLPADVWVRKLHFAKKAPDREDVECSIDLVVFADNRDKLDYVDNSN